MRRRIHSLPPQFFWTLLWAVRNLLHETGLRRGMAAPESDSLTSALGLCTLAAAKPRREWPLFPWKHRSSSRGNGAGASGSGEPTPAPAGPEALIADAALYHPMPPGGMRVFHPWLADPDIEKLKADLAASGKESLVDWDRLWTVKYALRQTRDIAGEIWEAGVFQGGSALFLKRLLAGEQATGQPTWTLRLFDTFAGLPRSRPGVDWHRQGEFANTSLEEVISLVGRERQIDYRQGLVPATFLGLEGSVIRMAHVDLDLYEGTRDACAFVYPRLAPGAVMVIDDYGFITCPGVRRAVDEYFADKPECPQILLTGQAVIHRLPR